MSRGRTPRSRPQSISQSPVRRAVAAVTGDRTLVESLEDRCLLTTLTGGQQFVYEDAAGNSIQITLTGSITAEFLAGRVPKTTNARYTANSVVVRDLIQPNPDGGADLFSIYVAEAGPGASIYIAQITTTGLTPYNGTAGNIQTNSTLLNPAPDNFIFPISGPGVVYIGARTVDTIMGTTIEEQRPITSARNTSIFGVRPSTRVVYAGLQTAAGVNLDNVFIGGTITGIVNVEGSLGTFYAGSVLTGDASGLTSAQRSVTTNNFSVAGDLQRMYVGSGTTGAVGTNGNNAFRTGVNIRVGGRLGYLHVAGNWMGQVQDRAVTDAPSITTPMPEGEIYYPNARAENGAFISGQLAADVTGRNGTGIANSQFSYSDTTGNMAWDGVLQDTNTFQDDTDNYSLPLMAEQTATLELLTNYTSPDGTAFAAVASLQVLDPTGRVVASDLSGPTNSGDNLRFQYTAKIPGVYTLSVKTPDNSTQIGTYRLLANADGYVPVGGASVGGTSRFLEPGNGVALRRGDLGAWIGTGTVSGDVTGDDVGGEDVGFQGSPIVLSHGNLRAFYSAAALSGVNLIIPRGSVGHLRSGGNMIVNPAAEDVDGSPLESAAIGGDIQRVEAGANLAGAIVANGRIGTIIAATIQAVNNQGIAIISANTDQLGSDGTVDMIYVTGDFGSVNLGGPSLYNGLNGDIKYVYVGGVIYNDTFFGGGLLNEINLEAGRSINFVDDSGTRAIIRPTDIITTSPAPTGSVPGTSVDPFTGATTIISFDPVTGTLIQTVTAAGALDYQAYGVRGVGGQVMINVHSTTSLSVTGLTRGQVEIGNIVTNGTGSAPVIGTLGIDRDSDGDGIPDIFTDVNRGVTTTVGYPGDDTTTPTDPNTPVAGEGFTTVAPVLNELNFYGPAQIDVFHITGGTGTRPSDSVPATNITTINNFTTGEVVSVNATNLGMINARRVGLSDAVGLTGLVVPGNMGTTGSDTGAALPYDLFSRGISVTGPIISVLGRDGVGNVSSGSTINTVNPNSDGRNARGDFDGIDGAIRAATLNVVQIGEGIAFGGSGTLLNTGLFASSTINNVVGNEADIRGPVIANNYINSIVLTNGSIVNARVGTFGDFANAQFTRQLVTLSDPPSNLGFALNQILIRGNGGIMGSDLEFGNFANITVDGFGIIGSDIQTIAASNINGQINVSGFGVRSSTIDAGSSIRTINVNGNGRVLSTASYSSRVNQSGGPRKLRFDPNSGRLLDGYNDLNRFFGTSRTSPKLSGATNAGVIADTLIRGQGTLGVLNAYAYTTADLNTPVSSPVFFNGVTFASNIGTVNIAHTMSGVQVRAGKLDNLNVGTNLQRSDIRISGEIGSVNVGGTIRGSTNIVAQNVSGGIGSIVVKGGLYGTVTAQGQIGTIGADTIGATIISIAAGITRVGVTNDVLTGTLIQASRTINRIIIGGDFQNDATIQARDIGVFRVGGANLGDVIDR